MTAPCSRRSDWQPPLKSTSVGGLIGMADIILMDA